LPKKEEGNPRKGKERDPGKRRKYIKGETFQGGNNGKKSERPHFEGTHGLKEKEIVAPKVTPQNPAKFFGREI